LVRRTFLAMVVILVLVAGESTAAYASPSSFDVARVHVQGATAVRVTGGLTWHNRSVTLTNVRLYVKASECGSVLFSAYGIGEFIDDYYIEGICPGPSGHWFSFGDHFLDATDDYGGIRELRIYVTDETHGGQNISFCLRSASACT
jgi:hypothetical protein